MKEAERYWIGWEQEKTLEQDIFLAKTALEEYYRAPLEAFRAEERLRSRYPFLEKKEWQTELCWSPISEPEILVRLRWEIEMLGELKKKKSA